MALRSAAFESALMMMVRVDPRVEPAASAGVTRPQVLADSGATSYADDGLEWHLSNGDGSTWICTAKPTNECGIFPCIPAG